uniref:Uncharacterized protein n=1 Tax=candidate division WOR-3 bacterium TaxID=2052148 RepID=A0A7V0Z705_UNCW3
MNFKFQISDLKIFLLLTCLSVIVCYRSDTWCKIGKGDFEIVEKGDYRGKLIYIPHPGRYEKLVEKYRREIEKNLDLLPLITKQLFTVKEELIFQYKFTWLDDENKFLVLRYFAHIYKDPIYAGYQVLFVYDIKTHKVIKIFVTEIPLE